MVYIVTYQNPNSWYILEGRVSNYCFLKLKVLDFDHKDTVVQKLGFKGGQGTDFEPRQILCLGANLAGRELFL
jgi:hypothetical protein